MPSTSLCHHRNLHSGVRLLHVRLCYSVHSTHQAQIPSRKLSNIASLDLRHRPFSSWPSLHSNTPTPQSGNYPRKSPKAGLTDKTVGKITSKLREALPATTETYVAYGACEILIKECARQADYDVPQRNQKDVPIPKTQDGQDLGVGTGWWYETLGLHPTFGNWAQITFLHMYLLLVRLRCFPPNQFPLYSQHLLDHFFHMAEDRMISHHNISARSIRNKYLKDFFLQWRGLQAGYDEGLIKGDAVFAAAVWRNVFQARENVDWRGVGEVVSYVRGCLKALEQLPDEVVVSGGGVTFGDPAGEREGVLIRSRLMLEKESCPTTVPYSE